MLAEVKATAAAEAAALKEAGKRELQSRQDRNRSETLRLQAKARANDRLKEQFKGTEYEPLVAGAELEEEVKAYRTDDQARQQAEMTLAQQRAYAERVQNRLKAAGIEVDEKRLDLAFDAPDPATHIERLLGSALALQGEHLTNRLTAEITKKVKAQIEQELGINSVDPAVSTGSIKGIPTSKAAFAKWYKNLPESEAIAREKEINDALNAGLIK